MKARTLAWLIGSALAGCDGTTTGGTPVHSGMCEGPGAGVIANPTPVGTCSDSAPCLAGQRCAQGSCGPDFGTCQTNNNCPSDTVCAANSSSCVPWGSLSQPSSDPSCAAAVFTPGSFSAPVVKCQWPAVGAAVPAYRNVLDTPLVADLDQDGQPEIIFNAGYSSQYHLMILSGKDCSVKADINTSATAATALSPCSHLAVADLDNDGSLEIISQGASRLVVYDKNGNILASTPTPAGMIPGAGCTPEHAPLVVNVDNAGPPEIIWGYSAVRYVPLPTPHFDQLWTLATPPTLPQMGYTAVAADLDGDDKPEIVISNKVVDGITGADKTKSIQAGIFGHPAVGDFNKDGKPDIAYVLSQANLAARVTVVDYANNALLMPVTTLAGVGGGPPTVADFDADGSLDFALSTGNGYYVISPDCVKTPAPAKCKGPGSGVLWTSSTQDTSSQGTGSSVFDFNSDGKPEAVYRDECWLRVYNGADGAKLFAAPVTSGTALEMPVVADTDNDGHADIVVASDDIFGPNNCQTPVSRQELGQNHPGVTYGVKVYTDAMNRWVPTRSIWNQHSYHITNVNDDGKIPTIEKPNWQTYNNFRQNVLGTPGTNGSIAVGDATTRDAGACTSDNYSVQVCNRGAAPLAPGMSVAIYSGVPGQNGSQVLCTTKTAARIDVASCITVSCAPSSTPPAGTAIYAVANDDGTGKRPYNECNQGNNSAQICGQGPARCTASTQCRTGQVCDGISGVCVAAPFVPECSITDQSKCDGRGLVCELSQGLCRGCQSDAECSTGKLCATECGQCLSQADFQLYKLAGGGVGSGCTTTATHTTPASAASLLGFLSALLFGIGIRRRSHS